MIEEIELKELWQTVFGDGRSYIDRWFRAFFRPELTAVRKAEGSLAAMAFVLPVGTLYGDPCASLYAVASAPEMRGLGLGKAVTSDAVDLAQRAGFAHILLRPADRGLFRFYEGLGFSSAFPVTRTEIRLPAAPSAASPCGADRYLEKRDTLLDDKGSVRPSAALLSFFTSVGGRLYAGDGFCAAVENEDGRAFFRELITARGIPGREILSSMASDAAEAVVILPASGSAGTPSAMRYGAPIGRALRWPGLMLD